MDEQILDEVEEVEGEQFLLESLKRFTSYLRIEADVLCNETAMARTVSGHGLIQSIDDRARSYHARVTDLEKFLSAYRPSK